MTRLTDYDRRPGETWTVELVDGTTKQMSKAQLLRNLEPGDEIAFSFRAGLQTHTGTVLELDEDDDSFVVLAKLQTNTVPVDGEEITAARLRHPEHEA